MRHAARFHPFAWVGLFALAPLLRAAPGPVVRAGTTSIEIDGAPVFLKGVDYGPFIAGDAPWLAPTGKADVRADVRDIKRVLGANAVRVYAVLPRAFYDEARQEKLHVIQGFYIPNADDLLEPVFLAAQKAGIRDAIDRLLGEYAAGDVIIAYAIGSGISPASIAGTVAKHPGQPRFCGKYYCVPPAKELPPANRYPDCPEPPFDAFPDPHPFQSFLAELAEAAAEREDKTHGQRHLIGYAATAAINPFLGARDRPVPEMELPVDLGFLDVIFENLFTYDYSYILYEGLPAYLRRLKVAYPEKPVIVLETGYSTSPARFDRPPPACGSASREPAPLSLHFGGATEEDQAAAIEARWTDVRTAERPLAGFFVFAYYEEWWYTGDAGVQDDHPLEYFGLKRVRGTPASFQISPKPAYWKVAELFGCGEPDADPNSCGPVIRTRYVIDGTFGVPFAAELKAVGGTPPYRWAIDPPDGLPAGLTFDPAGHIGGVPERMGEFRIRLRLEDAGSPPRVRERTACIRIGPPAFSTQGRRIHMNGEPFFLRGIDYSPFIAGDAPWTSMRHADPFDDLREIKEVLHANAIRVYQTLPKTVYDAARENGLFVIQGIHLQVDGPWPGSPECRTTPMDLLEPAFFGGMKRHVIAEIDEIHHLGASDVVLCFVVGNEVNFCVQRATILKHQDRPRYRGTYYSAPAEPRLPPVDSYPGCPKPIDHFEDPHPFQSFIAELADAAASREVERFGMPHHLMGHATDPNLTIALGAKDLFYPEEHFPCDMSFLDIVFQNVYGYFPPYLRFIGYLEYLRACRAAYPGVPFVVLECGYSVSPEARDECAAGPVCGQPAVPRPMSLCFGNNTEEEQARGIATHYREAISEEDLAAGFFVFEYYDEWWKGSNASEWIHDREHPEEWFGLKAVEGEGDRYTIRNRPAFETVARMFDTRSRLFRRGYANADAQLDLADAIQLLMHLFAGTGMPCRDADDINDDGQNDIADPIVLLNYLFTNGPRPADPFEACGKDPTDDPLGCEEYPPCGP